MAHWTHPIKRESEENKQEEEQSHLERTETSIKNKQNV